MGNFNFTIDGISKRKILGHGHHFEMIISPSFGAGFKPERSLRIIGLVRPDYKLELRASVINEDKKYMDLSQVLIIESDPIRFKDDWLEFEKKHGRKPASYEEVYGGLTGKVIDRRNRVNNGRKAGRGGFREGLYGRNVVAEETPATPGRLDTGKSSASLERGDEGVGDLGEGKD